MSARGILHLTSFLQGGAGRAITDLACAQQALGHDVTVVTSATGHSGYGNYPEYLARLRDARVPLYLCDSLFTRDIALNLQVLELLRHRIDVERIAVVHAHAGVAALVGRMYAAHATHRVAVVQTQHGWGTSKTPDQVAADLAILREVDRVVVTSDATREHLGRLGVPPWNVSVIPCGLDVGPPAPPPDEAVRLLQPYRERGAKVIGCIGSVTANKNQALLVEALARLDDPGVVAAFIGEDGDGILARAATASASRGVLRCGYQPEAARWLPLMDLLVLPSRSEGQGLVVVEAFRAGVPVVATNIPPLARMIEHQRSGFLFEAGNADALATIIRAALAMPAEDRDAIARTAKQRFRREFTSDAMVARHEALYEQLAGEATNSSVH
jgi:glycosyltransferase involved in cell wall biosynthesis